HVVSRHRHAFPRKLGTARVISPRAPQDNLRKRTSDCPAPSSLFPGLLHRSNSTRSNLQPHGSNHPISRKSPNPSPAHDGNLVGEYPPDLELGSERQSMLKNSFRHRSTE